jgi:hypothetical protein
MATAALFTSPNIANRPLSCDEPKPCSAPFSQPEWPETAVRSLLRDDNRSSRVNTPQHMSLARDKLARALSRTGPEHAVT